MEELSTDVVMTLFERSQQKTSLLKRPVSGALCFFELSSRTKLSFERAGQLLGLQWLDLEVDRSSLQKGESARETLRLLKFYGAEFLVVRHAETGFAYWAQQWTGLPVFNAGDGAHEHPTQALADALCLWEKFGRRSLKIAYFGDVSRSRVARSGVKLFQKLGHEVGVVDDASASCRDFARAFELPLIPRSRLTQMNIVYALRTQKERGGLSGLGPLLSQDLGLESFVMHAGPVVEGEDLSFELCHFESPRSLVHEQVKAGLKIRTALLSAWAETVGGLE